MYDIFKDIDGAVPYFDDIVIASKTIEEHCTVLRNVLTAARQHCLKFNMDKLQLAKSEIKYLVVQRWPFTESQPSRGKYQIFQRLKRQMS